MKNSLHRMLILLQYKGKAMKRKISSDISELINSMIEKDPTVEKELVEDYEKLNKKCEEVINKIKYRKVKKIK